jgi:hypothetical protein
LPDKSNFGLLLARVPEGSFASKLVAAEIARSDLDMKDALLAVIREHIDESRRQHAGEDQQA